MVAINHPSKQKIESYKNFEENSRMFCTKRFSQPRNNFGLVMNLQNSIILDYCKDILTSSVPSSLKYSALKPITFLSHNVFIVFKIKFGTD